MIVTEYSATVVIEGSHFYVYAPGLNLSWDERAAYVRWWLGE